MVAKVGLETIMAITPPEHPQLPFAGGLPSAEPPRGTKRKKRRPTQHVLPVPTRWWRTRHLIRMYLGDVGYHLAVKGGASVVILLVGLAVGDQKFDLFGRKFKSVATMELPQNWPATVVRGP